MHPTHPRASRAALLLALATTLAACTDRRDDGPTFGAGPEKPRAMIAADPEIDPSDTYYVTQVVQEGSTEVSTPVPMSHPVTGEAVY